MYAHNNSQITITTTPIRHTNIVDTKLYKSPHLNPRFILQLCGVVCDKSDLDRIIK